MVGIKAYGAYIPRYRLNRQMILMGMGWYNPITMAYGRGEKAVTNYDEDSITMSVSAALDCLNGGDSKAVDSLYLCSTTLPHLERQNAAIAAGALNCRENIACLDIGGALTCGTRGIITAAEAAKSGDKKNIMVCASDSRLGKMGSIEEHVFGDAAAAFLVGSDNLIANLLGYSTITADFVSQRRTTQDTFNRVWEERWVRDEGVFKLAGAAVKEVLQSTKVEGKDIKKCIFGLANVMALAGLAPKVGLDANSFDPGLVDKVGDSGSSYALMLFAQALENAEPGDKILVVSFGSGADALLFEVTDGIKKVKPRRGVSGWLANKDKSMQYEKYTLFKRIIPMETGIRGELQAPTAFSTLWRERKTVLGFNGSRCKACGTVMFPSQRICVNPECRAIDQMEDYCFADKPGSIFTFTGDYLAYSQDPPAVYGMVDYEGGGRVWLDFTDCELKKVKVGQQIENSFRRKYVDDLRGVHGYFWKAIPIPEVEEKGGK